MPSNECHCLSDDKKNGRLPQALLDPKKNPTRTLQFYSFACLVTNAGLSLHSIFPYTPRMIHGRHERTAKCIVTACPFAWFRVTFRFPLRRHDWCRPTNRWLYRTMIRTTSSISVRSIAFVFILFSGQRQLTTSLRICQRQKKNAWNWPGRPKKNMLKVIATLPPQHEFEIKMCIIQMAFVIITRLLVVAILSTTLCDKN